MLDSNLIHSKTKFHIEFRHLLVIHILTISTREHRDTIHFIAMFLLLEKYKSFFNFHQSASSSFVPVSSCKFPVYLVLIDLKTSINYILTIQMSCKWVHFLKYFLNFIEYVWLLLKPFLSIMKALFS